MKPIHSTRAIDVSVTNLLDMILRLPESGSKIACKYISTPLLLQIAGAGLKFDLRYMLLVRSLRPLKLYVHEIFGFRFANKPFSMEELDDANTHITVTNAPLREMDCRTFVQTFNEQHGQSWSMIEERIFQMFREVFHCATREEPPLGIGSCLSSRTLYAAELMLELTSTNEIQPKLLEVNFSPDARRVCSQSPSFYNQVFNVLFRDLTEGQNVRDISSI